MLEILDADSGKYQVLDMICLGACFQLAEVVRSGPGPSRKDGSYGLVTPILCSVIGAYTSSQGIQVYHAPLETPEKVSEDQFADLGAIEDQVDPESRLDFQHQARLEAEEAFIHLGTSKRVQRALLRSALKRTQ